MVLTGSPTPGWSYAFRFSRFAAFRSGMSEKHECSGYVEINGNGLASPYSQTFPRETLNDIIVHVEVIR